MLRRKRKTFSLSNKNIKYKLMIAFSLTSVIPLLIVSYVFLGLKDFPLAKINLFFLSGVILAMSGFFLMRRMVTGIMKLANKAESYSLGQGADIKITAEDEIGDISVALDKLNQRIRDNIQELNNYGKKTKEINSDLNKKIMVLSSILQIGSFISGKEKLDEILGLAVERVSQLEDKNISALFLLDQQTNKFQIKYLANITNQGFKSYEIDIWDSFWKKVIENKESILLDSEKKAPTGKLEEFKRLAGIKNLIILPILMHAKTIGLLFVGNNKENFSYEEDDLEMVRLFSKQISIAIENDHLTRRTKDLEIKDGLTGVFNEKYIRSRLDEEIKRALVSQRPCGFVLLSIDKFQFYKRHFGEIFSDEVLKKFAHTLQESVRDIDKVARFGLSEFAILLPETNKRQALQIARELKDRVDFLFKEEPEEKRITTTVSISENPIDGISADEIIEHAKGLLQDFRQKRKQNEVIV